jgi:hypothetical protein
MLCDNCIHAKFFEDPFGSTDFCCLNKLSEYNKPEPNVTWIRSDGFNNCDQYKPKPTTRRDGLNANDSV